MSSVEVELVVEDEVAVLLSVVLLAVVSVGIVSSGFLKLDLLSSPPHATTPNASSAEHASATVMSRKRRNELGGRVEPTVAVRTVVDVLLNHLVVWAATHP